MIKGLTHDEETGVINRVTRFKGKISAGYGPNEGPNKTNHPVASGFFRFLKQVIIKKKVGGKDIQAQEWVENEDLQKKLKEVTGSETPRRIEFMCWFENPGDLFENFMAKYSSDGLVCTSQGVGSIPTEVYYENDKRLHKPRLFDGKPICPYRDCPDYKAGKCKETGIMKVYPVIDLDTNPYQFTTRSINTILAINSSLDVMYNLSRAAWKYRANKNDKEFKGLFGARLVLVHKKIKSGGHDVYISQVQLAPEFSTAIMSVIKSGVEEEQKRLLIGGPSTASLDVTDMAMLPASTEATEEDIPPTPQFVTDPEGEAEIEKDFPAGGKPEEKTLDAAGKELLNRKQ